MTCKNVSQVNKTIFALLLLSFAPWHVVSVCALEGSAHSPLCVGTLVSDIASNDWRKDNTYSQRPKQELSASRVRTLEVKKISSAGESFVRMLIALTLGDLCPPV